MKTVGIKELKARLSSYVDNARSGEHIIITEHGKEVAFIIPISKERRAIMSLIKANMATWSGSKPEGIDNIKMKGEELSATILEGRD